MIPVIIMIGVTGEVRGQVLVISGSTCAPCSLQDDDGDADYGTRRYVCSAVNELGNMMMGNAATILSTKMALPWISHRRLYAAEMFI